MLGVGTIRPRPRGQDTSSESLEVTAKFFGPFQQFRDMGLVGRFKETV